MELPFAQMMFAGKVSFARGVSCFNEIVVKHDLKMNRDSCSDRKRKRHDRTETKDEANEETQMSPLRGSASISSVPPGKWCGNFCACANCPSFPLNHYDLYEVDPGTRSYESLAGLPPVPLQRHSTILGDTSAVPNLMTAHGEFTSSSISS